EQIFDRFFTTKAMGLGMGLAICRSIVEDHGGRIWATRNVAHGITVRVELPCEEQSPSHER
ncbi:MAG TPA: ATP-binding protein, partial [Verrucomicrobiae bacterium]|nr:ATP-binding protein [Verrucomicrobiae bacterium]